MTLKKIYIPTLNVIVPIALIISSSILYSLVVLTYDSNIPSNITNTNTSSNTNNIDEITVCNRIGATYSLAFFGNLMILYGIFTKYISCIKESSNAVLILYVSFIFYLITIIIIFGFIQLNDCLNFYKVNIKIYKLVAIQYITCTLLLGFLAIDYTIYLIKKIKNNLQEPYKNNDIENF